MEDVGYLRENEGRFEFHYAPLALVIRGGFAEWVLEAAAEVVSRTAKLQADGNIEELMTLCEFGEATELAVDAAKFDRNARFEVMPQCLVSMGSLDYKWISHDGQDKSDPRFNENRIKRIHDMSLTRNDTFLQNENGVSYSGE